MKLSYFAQFSSALVVTANAVGASSVSGSMGGDRELQTCPFAETPAAPCCAFFALNFNLFSFDAYDTYYNDLSTLTLAEAGIYKGAAGIKEYIKFASAADSPYIKESSLISDGRLKGFDGTLCTFAGTALFNFTFEEDVIGDGTEFNTVTFTNQYFNVNDNKISKTDVYFAPGTIDFLFEKTSSPETNEFICDTMENTCDYNIGTTNACVNRLEALPVTQGGYFDGDSQGCRALHAVLAQTSPDLHCPHINFEDVADPNGNFKCSESQKNDPKDIFDEDDFKFFDETCDKYGIDPAVGHIVIKEDSSSGSSSPAVGTPSLKAGFGVMGVSCIIFMCMM